jgi:hypothetical protein
LAGGEGEDVDPTPELGRPGDDLGVAAIVGDVGRYATASPPAAVIASTVAARRSRSRPTATIRAPQRAMTFAVSAPMPELAPVTIAVRSVRSMPTIPSLPSVTRVCSAPQRRADGSSVGRRLSCCQVAPDVRFV